MNKIKKFLIDNYYSLYENPEIFESFIQKLKVSEILHIVTFLNKLLRNKENENVICDSMGVGELVAPTSIIRETIIEKYLQTVKEISDNKLRAELTYHTFIKLHMFSDGNGRTSRLLYGLISGEIEDSSWYIHSDAQKNPNGSFCSYKGIEDEVEIDRQTELSPLPEQYITKHKLLKSVHQFKTYYNGIECAPIDKVISPDLLNQLTDEEKNSIFLIINDNDSNYSIAGLTMLIVTSKNGQLEEWLERRKNFC